MMNGIYLMPLWCVANLALLVLLEPQKIHSLKEVINQDITASSINVFLQLKKMSQYNLMRSNALVLNGIWVNVNL